LKKKLRCAGKWEAYDHGFVIKWGGRKWGGVRWGGDLYLRSIFTIHLNRRVGKHLKIKSDS